MNLTRSSRSAPEATRSVKGATNSTPPIVDAVGARPVWQGLAAILAHPGATLTGRSSQHFSWCQKYCKCFMKRPNAMDRRPRERPNPFHEEAWTEALAAAHP